MDTSDVPGRALFAHRAMRLSCGTALCDRFIGVYPNTAIMQVFVQFMGTAGRTDVVDFLTLIQRFV